jgi:hypothetical protein
LEVAIFYHRDILNQGFNKRSFSTGCQGLTPKVSLSCEKIVGREEKDDPVQKT